MNLKYLASPFPKQAVHWRAQSLTRNGDKAMALAYLDARDVQDRLDLVCGPERWQCEYAESARGRVICRIGIRVGDEWVWKADGAGDTAVEGEKGGISDAFKRAAVPWGIGRYLYRVSAPWVPCETYERSGKVHWKSWKENPWDHVKNAPPAPEDRARELYQTLSNAEDVTPIVTANDALMKEIKALVPNVHQHILALIEDKKAA